MTTKWAIFALLLAFLACTIPALASVPSVINYQGRLTQPSGAPVADGTYSMLFSIYDVPTGGTALWSETNPSVQVKGGLFAAMLGSVVGLPADLFDSPTRYFGVTVGNDLEMTPRQQIASVGYSFRAATVDDGAITTSKLAAATITADKLAAGIATPAGAIMQFGGSSPPTGWLLCDGSAVIRTGANAALFAAVGTAYGAGNGSTTFTLPNLQDRFPIGKSGTKALGAIGGEATHALSVAELPAHFHNLPEGRDGNLANPGKWITRGWTNDTGGATAPSVGTGSAGSGSPHNNIPPYQAVNYIIKI